MRPENNHRHALRGRSNFKNKFGDFFSQLTFPLKRLNVNLSEKEGLIPFMFTLKTIHLMEEKPSENSAD